MIEKDVQMDLQAIILFVVAVLIIFLLFKILKSLFKAIIYFLALVSIIIIISSAFVYMDARGFKEGLDNASNVFVLSDENSLVAGYESRSDRPDERSYFSVDELRDLQGPFEEGELDDMLRDRYKLFIIDISSFSDDDKDVGLGNETYELERILGAIEHPEPLEYLFEMGDVLDAASTLAAMDLEDETEFKGFLFAVLYSEFTKEYGSFFLIRGYKEERITIHPETLVFKFLKRVPMLFFRNPVDTVKDRAKDKEAV